MIDTEKMHLYLNEKLRALITARQALSTAGKDSLVGAVNGSVEELAEIRNLLEIGFFEKKEQKPATMVKEEPKGTILKEEPVITTKWPEKKKTGFSSEINGKLKEQGKKELEQTMAGNDETDEPAEEIEV